MNERYSRSLYNRLLEYLSFTKGIKCDSIIFFRFILYTKKIYPFLHQKRYWQELKVHAQHLKNQLLIRI